MRVSLIVAVAENGVIGQDGALPWRIPSELRNFRRLTMGKPLIMGRRTFQSLGRPLDGRDTIVLSRDTGLAGPAVVVCPKFDGALALARERAIARGADEIMVIGGAGVFEDAIAFADRVYLTRVHASPPGDVFFESLDPGAWVLTDEGPRMRGPRDEFAWTLQMIDRNQP